MRLYTWIVFASLLISQLSFGQSGCLSLAKTDLEKIFCQIMATPEGKGLPSFADFRRNNAQIQQLLLKRPARRLGIALPTKSNVSKNVAKKVIAASPPQKPSTAHQQAKQQSRPSTQQASLSVSQPTELLSSKKSVQNLANCTLRVDHIACQNRVYSLMLNRQNKQLAPGVLGVANTLELSPYQGSLNDKTAVNNYLADSYQHYIDKMLLIGLGGSTMTYTKFHYTFWELVEKNEDFATRVGAMYDYIKKDKASMAVKTRYGDELPGGIDWCMDLSDEVVVCDNGKKNWVYVRQS